MRAFLASLICLFTLGCSPHIGTVTTTPPPAVEKKKDATAPEAPTSDTPVVDTSNPSIDPCGHIDPTSYKIIDFANQSAVTPFDDKSGVTYTFRMPMGFSSGFLQAAHRPGSPIGLETEWAISKCPGDFGYYKSSEAETIDEDRAGQPVTSQPCGKVFDDGVGVLHWSTEGSFYQCKIPLNGTYYINMRYKNNCAETGDCPFDYYWSGTL